MTKKVPTTPMPDTTELSQELAQVQERERRALADYQNLVKRTQEERLKTIKFANRELLAALLQPLDHLALASAQLQDKGLDMVTQQFWQVLKLAGLEEIECEGKRFDPLLMEAVEAGDKKETVLKCVKKGYTLHGEVLQPARVIVD